MGILARSLLGNLSIWWEILTFEIKKYIRNSGKSDFLARKYTFFQAVVARSGKFGHKTACPKLPR